MQALGSPLGLALTFPLAAQSCDVISLFPVGCALQITMDVFLCLLLLVNNMYSTLLLILSLYMAITRQQQIVFLLRQQQRSRRRYWVHPLVKVRGQGTVLESV